MTNSSKQSSLIISITWVNACNHGSNCCSEEGLFSHASLLATKKRLNVKIFALIFLTKYTFVWKTDSPILAVWAFKTVQNAVKQENAGQHTLVQRRHMRAMENMSRTGILSHCCYLRWRALQMAAISPNKSSCEHGWAGRFRGSQQACDWWLTDWEKIAFSCIIHQAIYLLLK